MSTDEKLKRYKLALSKIVIELRGIDVDSLSMAEKHILQLAQEALQG